MTSLSQHKTTHNQEHGSLIVAFTLAVILHLIIGATLALLHQLQPSPEQPRTQAPQEPTALLLELPPEAPEDTPVPEPVQRPDNFQLNQNPPNTATPPDQAIQGANNQQASSNAPPQPDTADTPAIEGSQSRIIDSRNSQFREGSGNTASNNSQNANRQNSNGARTAANQPAPQNPELNTADSLPSLPDSAEQATPNSPSSSPQAERRAITIPGRFNNRGLASIPTEATPIGRYMAEIGQLIGREWQRQIRRRSVRSGHLRIQFRIREDGEDSGHRFLIYGPSDAGDLTLDAVLNTDIPPMPTDVIEQLDGLPLLCEFDFTVL